MKSKLIIICSLLVVLVFGFLYTQKNLIADDKDGKKKDCSSSCTEKKSSMSIDKINNDNAAATVNAGLVSDNKDKYAVYEFTTDKIHCDGCKSGMSEKLMGITGVKEVSYDATSKDTKLTTVKVSYLSTDTTPEVIAASVKENKLGCTEGKCDSKKSD